MSIQTRMRRVLDLSEARQQGVSHKELAALARRQAQNARKHGLQTIAKRREQVASKYEKLSQVKKRKAG